MEQALARLVLARETYQELMSVEQPVGPVVAGSSGQGVLEEHVDGLGEVPRETVEVFQGEREALDCRTVALGLGLAGTPAGLETARNRIARPAPAAILVRADRGRHQLAEAGAAR